MLQDGLAHKIAYQISLARSKNSDFVNLHPNEAVQASKQDYVELTKRVKKEFEKFQNTNAMRLRKKTGPRRTEA